MTTVEKLNAEWYLETHLLLSAFCTHGVAERFSEKFGSEKNYGLEELLSSGKETVIEDVIVFLKEITEN